MKLDLEFEDVKPGMILVRIIGSQNDLVTVDGWWQLYIVKEKTETKLKGIRFHRKGDKTALVDYNITKRSWDSRTSGFENTMTRSMYEIIQGIF